MKYGLVAELQELGAYLLGSSPVPFIPYQEDGNWEPFLPKYEPQADDYETWGCSTWGTQNQIEIFYKRVYGIEPNYSERFTYVLTPVKPHYGAYPQDVYDCIRRDGLIDAAVFPNPDTLDEFIDPSKITNSMRAKGQNWLHTHDFMHEWLWDVMPVNYVDIIKNALRSSPIAVSVTAWNYKNGVYIDNGQPNNHWCVCYRIDDAGIHVFDSYDHSQKILAHTHKIQMAKRIWLNRKTKASLTKHRNILLTILDRLMMKKTFLDYCTEALGTDASPRDDAPDELGCADTVSRLLQKVYPVPHFVSTIELNKWLNIPSNGFNLVFDAQPGTIIISPTEGTRIGHVGVIMEDGTIASNDSGIYVPQHKGKFLKNYTLETWNRYYKDKQKLPVIMYRKA